jgi:hypothetical protein
MIPWLIAGSVTLVVIVAAAIVVFRIVVMAADVEMDDGDLDDMNEFGSQWRAPAHAHSH